MDYLFSIPYYQKLLSLTKDRNWMPQRTGQQMFRLYFSAEIPTFLDNPLVPVVKDLLEP